MLIIDSCEAYFVDVGIAYVILSLIWCVCVCVCVCLVAACRNGEKAIKVGNKARELLTENVRHYTI
jgi:hypothetical protein